MRKNIITAVELKRIAVLSLIGLFLTSIMIITAMKISGKSQKGIGPIANFTIKSGDIKFTKENGGGANIQVYLVKQGKIEEMSLEEYVRGVVSAEMPVEFDLEALKAQAVAARTFAAAHMEIYGGKKYKDAKGANVCDTVQCQVFMHKEDRMDSWPKNKKEEYWNKVTEAVKQTAGEFLTYEGKLVMEPYYFAVSSGRTEECEAVFTDAKPYLKSVESKGEEVAPKYKSNIKISNNEFLNKINSTCRGANLKKINIGSQISIVERNKGGSVKQMKIGKSTISGVQFRSVMGLNSANFTLKFSSNEVEINCRGYGHGVGMSQWGANAMAKDGKKYNEILEHYYQGVKIVTSSQMLVTSN